MKEEKKKHAGGRPSKFGTIDLKKLGELAGLGLTDKQMAHVFGICEDTFYEYKKDPEFSEVLKRGKGGSDEVIERSLFERASGYTHKEEVVFCHKGKIVTHETEKHYPPDPTSMIFWLKNRKPKEWKDKRLVEGDKDSPLVISFLKEDADL